MVVKNEYRHDEKQAIPNWECMMQETGRETGGVSDVKWPHSLYLLVAVS